MSWVTPEKFAAQVILNVCELSDYTSPDDQPDLLQCTVTELEACVIRAFEFFDPDKEACKACEGSGETGHVWHDGTPYSDRKPPCIECNGTGKHTVNPRAEPK